MGAVSLLRVPDEAYPTFDFLLDQGQCQAQNLSVAFEHAIELW